MSMAKCWHYDGIDKTAKDNCCNCQHWSGKRCNDEAMLIAEFDRLHRAYEYMMQHNKGVVVDG